MKRPFLIALILCAILPLFCAPLLAANHALLVGVGKYPFLENRHQLEGPAYDVSALKAALKNAWGFEEGNITTLVDEDATKEKILKTLDNMTRTTQPGDRVFVYFSGHGTSSHDPKNLKLGIDPFTGALVPADFRMGSVDVEGEDLREGGSGVEGNRGPRGKFIFMMSGNPSSSPMDSSKPTATASKSWISCWFMERKNTSSRPGSTGMPGVCQECGRGIGAVDGKVFADGKGPTRLHCPVLSENKNGRTMYTAKTPGGEKTGKAIGKKRKFNWVSGETVSIMVGFLVEILDSFNYRGANSEVPCRAWNNNPRIVRYANRSRLTFFFCRDW